MEHFKIDQTKSGFHIDGFPDATKVIKLSGPTAHQISDLTSHLEDLSIALESLEGINKVPLEISSVREGLWRSAIIHCMKCFSDSKSRKKLDFKKVCEGNPDALEVYRYFKNLRNKHIAHDENAYIQCIPGAILNRPSAEYKIAKIICFSAVGETLEQGNYSNLHKMVTEALNHVDTLFQGLCTDLAAELEGQPYEKLAAMEEMTYSKPRLEDLGNSRARHDLRPS